MELSGQIALVTGASRGIGAAIAQALAQQGAMVIGTSTTAAGAATISQALQGFNPAAQGVVLDVTQPGSIEALMIALEAQKLSPSILINNAAITRDNLLMRMKDEEWEAVVNANLSSVFRLCKAVLRGMIKARFGRIINISSVVGETGNPGQCNYAAAKAGLSGFTKSLAREVASRGITVNAVAPGFIDTDMTRALNEAQREALLSQIPVNRLGRPEDVAAAVVFLASKSTTYITGETLHVNGGMYMP
ncbi:MAG TPA: 3-oxoacyl-ACP reductase FabG [Gammaproteobacteria bacterium]|nr:3-oxoacyl-ACP reductase FabG [Gammaproteobacteria bacterium]